MARKVIFIKSYYSEWIEQPDGVYVIEYPKGVNIKKEIKRAYKILEGEERPTTDLSCVLDYLSEDEGLNLVYEKIKIHDFDCSYGMFKG